MSCFSQLNLVLVARLDPLPVLVSPVQRYAKIGHLVVQEPEPALQRLRGPRPDLRCGGHRAGGILRLGNSRLELEPAGVELPLQRTRAREQASLSDRRNSSQRSREVWKFGFAPRRGIPRRGAIRHFGYP